MPMAKLALKIVVVAALSLAFGSLLTALAHACGARSATFAFLLVWLSMCWVTLLSWAFPLRLPAAYYALRPGERDGRRYERIGVLVAKRVLRRGPMQVFNPTLRLPTVRDAQSLAKLDAAMRSAETNHVMMFLVVVLVIAHAIARGWWDAAAWTLLFNILINGYPVMLQRYNRGRLASL
jgi:glycosyl-4,4'-diaponeurosporenoate acyltransferase